MLIFFHALIFKGLFVPKGSREVRKVICICVGSSPVVSKRKECLGMDLESGTAGWIRIHFTSASTYDPLFMH